MTVSSEKRLHNFKSTFSSVTAGSDKEK